MPFKNSNSCSHSFILILLRFTGLVFFVFVLRVFLLIHEAYQHSPCPVVITVFTRVLSVRTSVPTFQNIAKQKRVNIMIATERIVSLAEWIVDDTCLVQVYFLPPMATGGPKVASSVVVSVVTLSSSSSSPSLSPDPSSSSLGV